MQMHFKTLFKHFATKLDTSKRYFKDNKKYKSLMQLSIITNKEIFNDMFKKAVRLLQFLDLSILLIEIHENIQNLKLKNWEFFLTQ